MKIGIVLSKPPSYSETFFVSKIKGLQRHGHEVILFVQSGEEAFDLCTVNTALPIYRRNIVKQLYYVLKVFLLFIRHFQVCLRFMQTERVYGTGWIGVIKKVYVNMHILTKKLDWLHFGFATMALGKEHVAKAIKAKMAVSFRGFDMAIYPIKYPNCYKVLWEQVDKVHTISNDLYQLALTNGLNSEIPFQKITPAIDVNNFNRADADHQKSSDTIKIMTVARLHWKKGLTYTLQALKLLKDKGIDFQYTIIGEGTEYEKLMYIRYQLGLEKEVQLIGKVPHSTIKELLVAHDIYVQYSISEGFCNAVIEAQAMGLLCVVSDAEGLSENVLHNKSGWVVPKRSPEKLATKIAEIIELEKNLKKKITDFAMDRVKKEFNLKKQQQEFVTFYTE
ncbi:glycosyltransferase family 4 protein [Urechidicola vernalis]|uniref:Glycosyltransferase family 4 protein n=1 Tax=Urechidicola vernalis TaxID=3075600 RepID=A0ABU2Y237_9FLAO|nr:glycosyltransferase family 4 protein [Urechidicola sp. P050]MDT0552262.1 glycosyltransferase family 4 protein [Urechidicola sp. P050]